MKSSQKNHSIEAVSDGWSKVFHRILLRVRGNTQGFTFPKWKLESQWEPNKLGMWNLLGELANLESGLVKILNKNAMEKLGKQKSPSSIPKQMMKILRTHEKGPLEDNPRVKPIPLRVKSPQIPQKSLRKMLSVNSSPGVGKEKTWEAQEIAVGVVSLRQ